MWKTRGILLPKSSVHHFPQTTKRVARPVSSVKIVFQQKQNIQTQRYTSTQDNEDIKTKICERAPLGIQPSTMNFARRSTHNPRTQHQTCVPLHVRHGGLCFFLKKRHPWWNTMVFALCGRQHGPHAYKSSTQTGICTEETRASSVEWTQHKLRSSPREHIAHTTCGIWCYVITWFFFFFKKIPMPN